MPDSLQPNPLTIGPDGDVQAQGVDLPAPAIPAYPPGAQNSVRWLRSADGAMVAEIDTYDQGGTSSEPYFRDTVKPANYGPLGNSATREIGVYDHNSNPILRLLLNLANDGYGSGEPNADDQIEIQHRQNTPLTVYRASDGASNFLQLTTAMTLLLAGPFGASFPLIGPNGTDSINVAHNLGWVTQGYLAWQDAVFFTLALVTENVDIAQVQVHNTDPANAHAGPNVSFYVIGHP